MNFLKTISAVLLLAAMLMLSACGECTNHLDTDKDGKCDTCGKTVTNTPCATCNDSDGDGVCDTCNNPISSEPCDEHTDADGDGVCDVCASETGAKPAEEILLVDKEGTKLVAKFRLVLPKNANSGIIKAVDFLIRDLAKLGLEVEKVDDVAGNEQECEVLIGDITSRGDKYSIYRYDLGEKGYTVRIIDKKIVIQAGSDGKFEDALDSFKTNFLGIKSSTKKLNRVTVLSNVEDTVIQDDYRVKNLTVMGEDMKGYKIVADMDDSAEYTAAKELQIYFYTQTGYYFEIVSSENAPASNVIVISKVARTGGLGFELKITQGKIEFISEYDIGMISRTANNIERGKEIYNLVVRKIAFATGGTVDFTASDNCTKNLRDVYYEDFGAKGDGQTDDITAIRATHEFANVGGHTVLAKPNATYYVGKLASTINIMTNVDWGDAKFIIDDTAFGVHETIPDKGDSLYRSVAIFTASGTAKSVTFDSTSKVVSDINAKGGINSKEITRLELELGYPVIATVVNENHINYIRYGVNANNGKEQTERVLVNADGTIDSNTPFLFDYEEVSYISAKPVDDEPITIKGGEFTTIANIGIDNSYSAYGRGINIRRSNVTFDGVKHYITGEGELGHPYGGFHVTGNSVNNIRFYRCVYTAHKTYTGSNGAGMGSYDISTDNALNLWFEECTTSNFFATGHWGVMGSSGSKNITYKNCSLTRFDAHAGLWNGTIEGGEIKMIRITGAGTFKMKDVTIYPQTSTANPIQFREDYGGFWHGDVILENVTIKGYSSASIFRNIWYNHDFGYPTALPTTITIDNLKMVDSDGNPYQNATASLFNSDFLAQTNNIIKDNYDTEVNGKLTNVNKMTPPAKVIIKNNHQGINFNLPDPTVYPFFADMQVIKDDE